MSEIATINIDKKTVETIVQNQMETAIIRELGGAKDLLIEKIVAEVVNSKVDSQGRLTKDSWEKQTLIQFLCKEKIRKTAESAIEKFFEKESIEIEKALLKELTKQKAAFAKAAVASMVGSVKSAYRYNFSLKVEDL